MDQPQQPSPPTLNPPPSSATSSAAEPPHQPQPQPQPSQPQSQSPQIQHQTTSTTPPSSIPSTPSTAIPNPNTNSISKPLPSAIPPPQRPHQPRPAAAFSSPWQQHSSQFTGSFGHPFGGTPSSNVSQARPMMRSVGSSSLMRPSGFSVQHQQRPLQSSLRPTSQFPSTQNFQGHSLMRVSAIGSSGSSTPSTPQTSQSPNQPWLSSGAQVQPPLPPHWHRPQISTPSLQPRVHIPQQHHSLPTVSQQQHVSSPQVPQTISLHQQQEHFEQQLSQSKATQSLPHQQQDSRAQSSAIQKPSSLAVVQPNTVDLVNQNKSAVAESDESGDRILSKRSIHDLVNQIDPSEKLEPEVEDILADIAEDFLDSITTFGCSLAKHRKSDTLEAKDILLHLERNWNMTLPGFSGDEIKTYKKPLTDEVHKERLAVIKKSILANEAANAKHTIGQAAVNAKGNVGKVAANILGSPNVKI